MPTTTHICLLVFVNQGYHEALEIPRATISHYARKPYKWLWFLGYIIFGCDGTDGYISNRPIASRHLHCHMSDEDMDRLELDDADDYIYYHSNGMYVHYSILGGIELTWLKAPSTDHRLVDAQSADTQSITTRGHSSSMGDTAENGIAEERDGHQCAASSDLYFQHCHLIPHAKGDEVSFNTLDKVFNAMAAISPVYGICHKEQQHSH